MFNPHIYGELPGLYTAGEAALVSSPLFRIHRLRLYRQYVCFINRHMQIQYMIVKSHIPVLVFRTGLFRNNNGHPTYSPGTADQPPICLIYYKNMMQGQMNEVLTRLEPLLKRSNRLYRKRCDYVPVPPEHHETMARLHMIEKQTDHIWFPTVYGDSLGLIDGYMTSAIGKPCHTFLIPPERVEGLYKAMTWDQTCREEPKAVMSLEQRLKQIRQGLPSNNASAVSSVKAFGAVPLADYMALYPDEAETLRQQFGEISTYQEAADRVCQVCLKSDSPDQASNSRDLIASLILPLIDSDKMPPDNRAAQPAQKLMQQPFPSLLMGAAMDAGQPCLLQNTRLILNDIFAGEADKLQTSCKALIRHSGFRERSIEEKCDMLFRLFVEPFALMNQSTNCR